MIIIIIDAAREEEAERLARIREEASNEPDDY